MDFCNMQQNLKRDFINSNWLIVRGLNRKNRVVWPVAS